MVLTRWFLHLPSCGGYQNEHLVYHVCDYQYCGRGWPLAHSQTRQAELTAQPRLRTGPFFVPGAPPSLSARCRSRRPAAKELGFTCLFLPLTAGGTRGSAFGATTPRRLESRHGGGRGAEERTRGARPRAAKLHEARSRQTWPKGVFAELEVRLPFSAFPTGKARCLSLPFLPRSGG